jgi:signal transduction histidine kinase
MVHSLSFVLIYFFYGLAFFIMGIVTALEVGRCADVRLRHALIYLAAFGLLHGSHEWLEMFLGLQLWPDLPLVALLAEAARMALMAFSFLSLGAFGALLLAPTEELRRLALLVPLGLAGLWAFGSLILRSYFTLDDRLLTVVDVWARYSMGIPAALLACVGLIAQQRAFRRAGMARFGRDSLWAAVAFGWYGLIGQLFTQPSPLPPSTFLNSELFLHAFGFPIQLVRAAAAVVVSVFVIRFLRASEVEIQRKIASLQAARLEEAERREALRGELLRRVVAAQEAERQRIARELHDETGQALTALGLGLRGVSSLLGQDECPESVQVIDKASGNLRSLENMVAKSLDELQRVISDLRPSHLDDLGLPAALRWYCNDLQNRVPLQISVELTGESRELPAEIKTAVFRVAQEALTNAVRHSQAKTAKVCLDFGPQAVNLEVQDDGCGFDVERAGASTRPSWGLLGMQERATLLGGRLAIYSRPGAGTRVQVSIPYEGPAGPDNPPEREA